MKEIFLFDIVVIGGGLGGTCAALAAARESAKKTGEKLKVALIQDRPILGGCSSSEIRVPPIGAGRHIWGYETGIIHELLLEERTRNHINWDNGTVNSIWDLILWETVKAEENLTLFLNTTVRSVKIEDEDKSSTYNKRIESVVAFQLGTEKEFEITGNLFVDATGDGTVGYEADADYRMGREAADEFGEKFAPKEADDACMGTSLHFQAKDIGRPITYTPPAYAAKYTTEESLCSRPHADFRNGYWWIEVGIPFHTIRQNEEIRDELIRHVMGVWDHLKNYCPNFKEKSANWVLEWFGWVPGKRESRRLMGDHILSEKDLKIAETFRDQIAYGGHFLDLHTMGGILAKGKPGNPVDINPKLYDDMRVIPYSIPLRSLYSRNISNLMMAGRNLSATHVAMGSTRVMLTNAVIGQGVGTTAAYAVSKNITPRECTGTCINEIQQSLLRQGCYLPFMKNNDINDLAQRADVLASSEGLLDIAPELDNEGNILEQNHRQSMSEPLGLLFPTTENRINHIWLWLESETKTAVTVHAGLKKAQHVWDYSPLEDFAKASAVIQPCEKGWIRFTFETFVEPNSLIFIHTESIPEEHKLFWRYRLDIPTGTASVWKRVSSNFWFYINEGYRKGFRILCMKMDPLSRPYGARNILSGVTRPERWTNIWVSDPTEPMPQYIELKWNSPMIFNKVEIIFDTDLSLTNESTPPFTKHLKCVRDYHLSALTENGWILLHEERDNYQRSRIHSINTVQATKLRLEVIATHGDPSARIYEMRVYNETK